jgi:hypothetical protein
MVRYVNTPLSTSVLDKHRVRPLRKVVDAHSHHIMP